MRILAVDYNGLFARHALVSNGIDMGKATEGVLAAVATHRQNFDRVALCVDSGKSWRTSVWPSYKANREDRGEFYRVQLRETLARLAKDGCSVFKAPEIEGGYAEADDVIGSLCAWARDAGHEVMILSADKDMLQLVREGVGVISLNGGAVYATPGSVQEKMGVTPERIPDLLALMGDTSDNYKLCPGIGQKTASALIETCGHALAVCKPEHWDRLHEAEYLGKALGEKFRATVTPQAINAALTVATIRTDLLMEFGEMEKAPEYLPVVDDSNAPSTAIAPRPVQEISLPYWAQPNYLGALWDVSKAFTTAGCFPNVGRPEQVMVVGMLAHEDGIGIATAMQHAYFVHGRLAWSATYLLMRARASGLVEMFRVVKSDAKECVIRVKRKGDEAKDVRFGVEEAARAQLMKDGGNWQKWPQEMCLARCIARALRENFRSECGGRYIPEEMSEELPEDQILASAREARAALGA